MSIDPTLFERLSQLAAHVASLRQGAVELMVAADAAVASGSIDTEMLEGAEISAGVLYQEISAFKTVLAEVDEASPLAAGQLAPVSDALHILLLEVTEIGTRLYGLRSDLMRPEASDRRAAIEVSSAPTLPHEAIPQTNIRPKPKPRKRVRKNTARDHQQISAAASGDSADEEIP